MYEIILHNMKINIKIIKQDLSVIYWTLPLIVFVDCLALPGWQAQMQVASWAQGNKKTKIEIYLPA